MIKLEISKHKDGRKTIYYRDEDYIAFRVAYFDCHGKLIEEELSEFTKKKQVLTTVRYDGDSQTVLGYREYKFNDNHEQIGFADYKLIDGQLKKVCSAVFEWVEFGQKSKTSWYDGDDEFLYYQLFIYEGEEFGMISQLCHYAEDGSEIEYGSKEVEIYR
ncbi:hypothetical protein [Acinetobacter venetianus]|uniref:hypothetical protein n=1 Tax=Acinetobacter venetianus TaxID=52133 RepID=UPI00289F9B2C|nr:hypothetical protein [Acinetobacter venetianus]